MIQYFKKLEANNLLIMAYFIKDNKNNLYQHFKKTIKARVLEKHFQISTTILDCKNTTTEQM